MPSSHIFLSPAKLNLGLKVVGKRADGYHLLNTIFCLIDLYDEVEIEVVTADSTISLPDHNQIWPVETDLAYRAAKLLQTATNTTLGANITVTKHIPIGGGLGGGSSNAATVLLMLNHLWQTHLSVDELIALGQTLGADVPFFIYGKNAFATGIGDEFMPIAIPQQYFILIKPPFGISTKEIFTNLNIVRDSVIPDLVRDPELELLQTKENDLEHIATKLYPQLAEILKDLTQYGEPRMTGTGSTIYLSYNDEPTTKKVAQLLKNRYNPVLVRSLPTSPLVSSFSIR